MKRFCLLLVSTLLVCACADDDDHDDRPLEERSILERARAEPSLKALVAALEFASDDGDLVKLLDAPGSMTLFAPTVGAFRQLASELTGRSDAYGRTLLVPAHRKLVRDFLWYHVLGMQALASELPFGKAIEPVGGGMFLIEQRAEPAIPVIIDGRDRTTRFVSTDLVANNGVIHIIERVLLPPDKDLFEIVQAYPGNTILAEALAAADLVGELTGPAPRTLFVPHDVAFSALLQELKISKAELLANHELLREVLAYHIVVGRAFTGDLPRGTPIPTLLQGEWFRIDSELKISDARGRITKIRDPNLIATNGAFHVIDRVLLPKP
jgi:uncharacterized surface protein with fasciclin (FAS1) repeats